MSGAETAKCPVVHRRIGGAEMALPLENATQYTTPNVKDQLEPNKKKS